MKKENIAELGYESLTEHFADESNHHLYKRFDDDTIVAYMCCDFEVLKDGKLFFSGKCGDGIQFNLSDNTIEKV